MWYSKIYRRHLADMHISDWDDSFLSEFSPETYVENLKIANVENAMIYIQSHTGLCYFPTKSGIMHKAFARKEDMIKRVIDLCHMNNLLVTGYYSLNYNTCEHDRHPDWRMLTENGKSIRENGGSKEGHALDFASIKDGRYGLCCPNNMDYRNFVYEQIDEIVEYFELEGMFFDMPYWHHTCYCNKCKKRWEKEVGGNIPVRPTPGSGEYLKLITKKYEWMGEWIQSITNYVKMKNSDLSIEYNFASAIAGNSENGCGEEVNNASDFVGGDLYGGIINHSLACKFYKNITKNQPFDYMFSRCKPALRTHTLTKTHDEMKTEVMMTAAHHGASLVIDAIDPIGTMDNRVYERIGKIFDYEAKYEKYLTGDMVEDVGLYYSMRSRFNSYGEEFDNLSCSKLVTETLIANHVPFGVCGSFCDIYKYKMLVIPCVCETEDKDNERIIDYVEKGGNVYISGAENRDLIEKLTSGKCMGRTMENNIYIAPKMEYEEMFGEFNAKYPLPFDSTAPIIEVENSNDVIAKITLPYTKPDEVRFASIHSDPPGKNTEMPAIIIRNYGKGKVIWSAVPVEAIKMYEYQNLFMNFIYQLCHNPSFKSNAPQYVEITLFDAGEYFTVNTVLASEKAKTDVIPPFKIEVKCERKPNSVLFLPDNIEISFEYSEGYVIFNTRELNVFDMYMIVK